MTDSRTERAIAQNARGGTRGDDTAGPAILPAEPIDCTAISDAKMGGQAVEPLDSNNILGTASLLDNFIPDADDPSDILDDETEGLPPKPFDLRVWRRSVTKGPLREEIDAACDETGMTLKELTVLSDKSDPYRFDTPAGHRNGQWFRDQIAQLLSTTAVIHLRGLHYIISSRGDVHRPNGGLYINDADCWEWLVESASNAARWLGYVPFARIRDERNAPSDSYILEDYSDTAQGWISCGLPQTAPDVDDIVPQPITTRLQPRQPYLIILLGEKSSLHAELSPVAREVEGVLILPTGEFTLTLVEDMVRRIIVPDGRPAIILYFHDFDPAGWQMAISVARKLQGLKTQFYLDMQVELHRAAVTRHQAEQYDLPSTPLKETERRAANWIAKTRREQTELDALIALHPGALQQIARDAIAPFYDDTLNERCEQAVDEWLDEAQQRVEASPGYHEACAIITSAHEKLTAAMQTYNAELERARALLPVIDDEIAAPEAEIDEDAQPEPLFTTEDDFVEATLKLIGSKNLEDA